MHAPTVGNTVSTASVAAWLASRAPDSARREAVEALRQLRPAPLRPGEGSDQAVGSVQGAQRAGDDGELQGECRRG